MAIFSIRNNMRTSNIPITIRNDAKDDFKGWLLCMAKRNGVCAKNILSIVCQYTYQAEDGNWSDEFIENEAKEKLGRAKWYYVYDVVEAFYNYLSDSDKKREYELEINTYFTETGYGWIFEKGKVLYRGSDIENQAYTNAIHSLSTNQTAQDELKLALEDLSRRPIADSTGTVQHAMAAFECFCRQQFNGTKSTLGDIIRHNRSSFTSPLDQAIEKLWGFASNRGRHVQNNESVSFEEAEFILNVCSSLIVYLSQTLQNSRIHP